MQETWYLTRKVYNFISAFKFTYGELLDVKTYEILSYNTSFSCVTINVSIYNYTNNKIQK